MGVSGGELRLVPAFRRHQEVSADENLPRIEIIDVMWSIGDGITQTGSKTTFFTQCHIVTMKLVIYIPLCVLVDSVAINILGNHQASYSGFVALIIRNRPPALSHEPIMTSKIRQSPPLDFKNLRNPGKTLSLISSIRTLM